MFVATQFAFLQYLLQVLEIALGPVLVVGAIAFLARGWFNRAVDLDLANHKSKLDQELEMHKSKLAQELEMHKSKLAQERELTVGQASLVHQKRALVVGELYRKLAKAKRFVQSAVSTARSGGQERKEDLMSAIDAMNDATEFFEDTRIYLTDDICERVEELKEITDQALITNTIALNRNLPPDTSTKLFFEAEDQFNERWPPLEESLRVQFGCLIGIDKIDTESTDDGDR